jgi:ATP-dependent helicase/nuclease subunit B
MNLRPPATDASSGLSGASALTLIPYSDDLPARLADEIIRTHADLLPDLTGITVLLPSPHVAQSLRRHLLRQAQAREHTALLGPEIDTLSQWVRRQAASGPSVISEVQRELMLVEALVAHSYLYGQGSPWTLADSLLALFDELAACYIRLPDNLDDFVQRLSAAYDISPHNLANNDALTGEARLVHTLWRAWQQQLQDAGINDRHTDYLRRLAAIPQRSRDDQSLYLAGFSDLSPAEIQWLHRLMAQGQAQLWLQGSAPSLPLKVDYHPDAVIRRLFIALEQSVPTPVLGNAYSRCLDSVFSHHDIPLRERAHDFSRQHPDSPVAPRLRLFEAGSAEQEALAIDLQVRRWWLDGHRHIGIVTENRRLARRVRALLERAGIELQDAAGWALSTTSAAATLERWLETVEQDFAHQPLLDLLKSPFLLPAQDRDSLLTSVYRFEQGVVFRENIGRGLERYRRHTRYRQQRLPSGLAADYEDIHFLLDTLAAAVTPLQTFLDHPDHRHPPSLILTALAQSLATLGLDAGFADDAAGQRILEELRQLQIAALDTDLHMHWTEFRGWLGRSLERFNFQPASQAGGIQLMSLAQSTLCRFDALIIASAEREYLPGNIEPSPFFNDGVRQALGLSSRAERLSQRYYLFRQLLEAAPRILVTRRTEQDGEDVVPSPWLERLQSFHHIAWGDDLLDTGLAELVGRPETRITHKTASPPRPVPPHPAPVSPPELLPRRLSASGYQQLMDCPYQFFAARCLGLEPPETIREMLAKSDYGERVHRCLQAFHSEVHSLPGPYSQPLNAAHRATAIRCLEDIAQAVFARDLEDNFLHRGWLKRWRDRIPAYIDWQMERQQTWHVQATEINVDVFLTEQDITLHGRLDRLDQGPDGIGIIDYKTGAIACDNDVLTGEAVQLPFYALLAGQGLGQTATQVEYLALDEPSAKTKATLTGNTLDTLAQQVGQRLTILLAELRAGAPLPAWGDDVACSRCQMSRVCRREAWQEKGSDEELTKT